MIFGSVLALRCNSQRLPAIPLRELSPDQSSLSNAGAIVNNLKLFVVGESSGDPSDWHELGRRAIVVAHDAEEAASMVDYCGTGVAELSFTSPIVIYIEENYGCDD